MKEHFEYCNDSMHIMPGFYESILYNYDMENDENDSIRQYAEENGETPVDHELNMEKYENAVCTRIVDKLIKPMLTEDNSICDEISFKEVSSPRQYNFTTDKIVCDLNIDMERLAIKILSSDKMREGFDKYLNHNYSDRSGFWSFVKNNVKEYFEEWDQLDVMVDYYILTKIYDDYDVVKAVEEERDFTHYEYEMMEIAQECMYEFMEPVKEEEE